MSRHHAALDKRRWERVRQEVLRRDGRRCQMPGCGHYSRMEIHHIIALDDGGPKYDLSNLIAYCRSCHIDCHRKPVYEWQKRWQALVDSL